MARISLLKFVSNESIYTFFIIAILKYIVLSICQAVHNTVYCIYVNLTVFREKKLNETL